MASPGSRPLFPLPFRLFRYLFVLSVLAVLAALLAVTAVYLAVDLVEMANQPWNGRPWIASYPWRLPLILTYTLPLAAILGVVLTQARLEASGEWIALRAAGLSPLRLASPWIGASLLTGALALGLAGFWGPWAMSRFLRLPNEGSAPLILFTTGTHASWVAESCEDPSRICRVSYTDQGSGGSAPRSVRADGLMENGHGWVFVNAWERVGSGPPVRHQMLPAPSPPPLLLKPRPADDPVRMDNRSLEQAIDTASKTGKAADDLKAELGTRYALWLGAMILPLVACAAARRLAPRAGTPFRAAASLVVPLLYWLFLVMLRILVVHGAVSPAMLAWGLPLLFAGALMIIVPRWMR